MIIVGKDCYFASGYLAADYPWLRFLATAMGGTPVGLFGEVLN
jgi:hypothetical protein